MQFLKNNSFYVGLALTFVVISGVLIFQIRSVSAQTDISQAKRKQMADKISDLTRAPMVNQAVLEARKAAVAEDRKTARELAEESVKWNRRLYTVLALPNYEGGKLVGTIPAFPIDQKLYADRALRAHFATNYNKKLDEMLKDISAITVPTDEEILNYVNKADELIRQAEQRETGFAPTESRRSTPARGGRHTGRISPDDMPAPPDMPDAFRPSRRTAAPSRRAAAPSRRTAAPSRRTAAPSRRTTPRAAPVGDAQQQGFTAAVVTKALTGPIYGNSDNLNRAIEPRNPDADNVTLFNAQVGLWVTQDILKAIKLTIEQSLKQTAPTGKALAPTVMNSGIKRIVSVKVEPGFSVGAEGRGAELAGVATPAAQQAGTGTRRSRRSRSSRSSRAGSSRYDNIQAPDSMMPPGGFFDPAMLGGRTTSNKPSEGTFTRRVSNPRYDVQRYSFTLIMESKYVPLLQKHLMAQNLHTITSWSQQKVDPADLEQGYYYGTSPVMEVTIEGELLLLVDWTRGKWIADGKRPGEGRWDENYPRIMPVEVLKSMHSRDSTSLRAEDKNRAGLSDQPAVSRSGRRH